MIDTIRTAILSMIVGIFTALILYWRDTIKDKRLLIHHRSIIFTRRPYVRRTLTIEEAGEAFEKLGPFLKVFKAHSMLGDPVATDFSGPANEVAPEYVRGISTPMGGSYHYPVKWMPKGLAWDPLTFTEFCEFYRIGGKA